LQIVVLFIPNVLAVRKPDHSEGQEMENRSSK